MNKCLYNQSMKKSIIAFVITVTFLFLPLASLAVRIQTYNGTVTQNAAGTITIKVERGTNYPVDQRIVYYTVKPTNGAFAAGDSVTFSVNEDVTPSAVAADSVQKGTNPNANIGIGSLSSPSSSSGFRLFSDLSCPEATALTCYTKRVFEFTKVAVLLLSIAAFVVAGIIYMTSAGSPKQVEMAKKIIIGALSAVAVVILGQFFLTNVVGVVL